MVTHTGIQRGTCPPGPPPNLPWARLAASLRNTTFRRFPAHPPTARAAHSSTCQLFYLQTYYWLVNNTNYVIKASDWHIA